MAHITTIESGHYTLDEGHTQVVSTLIGDPSLVMPIEPVETLKGDPASKAARALAVAGEYADRYAELRTASDLVVVEGLFAGYLEDIHIHTASSIPGMDAVQLGLIAMGDGWTNQDTLVLSVSSDPMNALEEFVNAGLEEFRAALRSSGVVIHEVPLEASNQAREPEFV